MTHFGITVGAGGLGGTLVAGGQQRGNSVFASVTSVGAEEEEEWAEEGDSPPMGTWAGADAG